MSYQIVNVGSSSTDNTADPIRIAFKKINNNFESLSTLLTDAPSIEYVELGTQARDGTGDTLQVAFEKIDNNFKEFAKLSANPSLTSVDPYDIVQDPLAKDNPIRLLFSRVNDNFAKLFTGVTIPAPVVVVEQQPESYDAGNTAVKVSDVSLTGTINITNNIFINHVSSPAPLTTFVAYGNQEVIDVGQAPNDGTGDPLRTAFQKINNNFSNLFFTTINTYVGYSAGLTPNQVILEIPVDTFSQGTFQIRTTTETNNDCQDVTISAQITSNGAGVKYSAHSTLFSGNVLTNYNMSVLANNVQLMVKPLVDEVMVHFISSQITYLDTSAQPGIPLGLNGFLDSVMATEGNVILTTES